MNRERFPGLRDGWARLDGPAGTQMVDASIDAMADFMRSGDNANHGGAFRAGAGQHTACLNAPDGADFDLRLQRLSRGGFRTVASQTGTGDKQLTFSGPAGTYRYTVVSAGGSGTYSLGFNVS